MKQKHIPQSVIARQNAARKASDALDAVPVLKRHFARVILAGEKIDEAELYEFMAAATAIASISSTRQLALANFGIAVVDALMDHYQAQLAALPVADQDPVQPHGRDLH